MIARAKVGRSFGGTIRYLFEGHKDEKTDKKAELLDYNGIRPEKEAMIKDFDRHRWLNPDLGNAVGHLTGSYHVDDSEKVNNTVMTSHARQLMIEVNIDPDNTQWALIRHRDRDHEHWHIVYNRVDYNGKTIPDNLLGVRAKEAATLIAREHGLTVALEKKKDLKLTHQDRMPGHDQVRYEIYEALTKELANASSISKLTKALQDRHGIETKVQKNGEGMSFKKGSYAFKASEIDRGYTGKKIHAQIELNDKKGIEEFLAMSNAMSRFQGMSSQELQTFFNQVGNKELKPTGAEIKAINRLIDSDPVIKLEYKKHLDGQAETRENHITDRLNKFYLVPHPVSSVWYQVLHGFPS